VCQYIGLCPKNLIENKQSNLDFDVKLENPNPLVCQACKFLVTFIGNIFNLNLVIYFIKTFTKNLILIDNQLKNNQTETSIIKSLKTACGILPQNIQAECDSLVSTYGVYIINFLIQAGDPNKVCPALKLC
jgi:hypothetical protein